MLKDKFDVILYDYAMQFVGKNYKWGGNGILGIDCSGLVLELMQSVGQVPHGVDMTAQSLFDYFQDKGRAMFMSECRFGALIFYGQSVNKITHIAFGLDRFRMIESGGGDHTTTSQERAEAQSAKVRIRPVDYRGDRVSCLRPYYRTIGEI